VEFLLKDNTQVILQNSASQLVFFFVDWVKGRSVVIERASVGAKDFF
jgi:hypothetical protein